jgi:hypothetical protein
VAVSERRVPLHEVWMDGHAAHPAKRFLPWYEQHVGSGTPSPASIASLPLHSLAAHMRPPNMALTTCSLPIWRCLFATIPDGCFSSIELTPSSVALCPDQQEQARHEANEACPMLLGCAILMLPLVLSPDLTASCSEYLSENRLPAELLRRTPESSGSHAGVRPSVSLLLACRRW